MSINLSKNLEKGQSIDLRKNDSGEDVYDLSSVSVGLGWDVHEEPKTLMDKLFSMKKKADDYDLDAMAFLLDENGFVSNLGKEKQLSNGMKIGLQGGDIIFFNNMTFPSGSGTSKVLFPEGTPKNLLMETVDKLLKSGELIVHTGDNLTGEGDGDDEQIIVRLNAMPARINKILFLVCIYQGAEKNQHFGLVENAFIRICDAKGLEIAKYKLSDNQAYYGMCSMIFGEVYRYKGNWKFRALGNPEKTDNFVEILKRYVKQ